MPWTFVQQFMVPRGCILITLEVPNSCFDATVRLIFHFFCEISQQLLAPFNLVQTFRRGVFELVYALRTKCRMVKQLWKPSPLSETEYLLQEMVWKCAQIWRRLSTLPLWLFSNNTWSTLLIFQCGYIVAFKHIPTLSFIGCYSHVNH